MKPTSNIRNDILHKLSSGEFCSGEMLGQRFGVSRSAIAKHVKSLQALGLDIFSVTGKGYKLAHEIRLFEKEALLEKLPSYKPDDIHLIPVVDSTSDYLKQLLSDNVDIKQGTLCLAEAQTAGRGRQGKRWVSPFGCSLYCSFYWQFNGGFQAVSGLSLAIGLAVVETLKQLGAKDLGLKWPNDIYHQGKKLAGILVDVDGQIHGNCQCVIGLGINMALPNNVESIDQPWSDLSQALDVIPDKNHLAAALIEALNRTMEQFQEHGLKPFVEKWNEFDVFSDSEVALIMGENRIVGIAKGIDNTGAVKLEITDEQGQKVIRSFFGGEISVRAAS